MEGRLRRRWLPLLQRGSAEVGRGAGVFEGMDLKFWEQLTGNSKCSL